MDKTTQPDDSIPALCAEAIASLVRAAQGPTYQASRIVPFLSALAFTGAPPISLADFGRVPFHLRAALFELISSAQDLTAAQIAAEVLRLDPVVHETILSHGVGERAAKAALTGLVAQSHRDPGDATTGDLVASNATDPDEVRAFLCYLATPEDQPTAVYHPSRLRALPATARSDAGAVFAAYLSGLISGPEIRDRLELGF